MEQARQEAVEAKVKAGLREFKNEWREDLKTCIKMAECVERLGLNSLMAEASARC